MKTRVIRSVASALSLSILISSPSYSSGLLMIDPGLLPHGIMPVPRPGRPPIGIAPPVLLGHVSYGLHLKDQDVKVTIHDQVAKTYIKQVFSNDTDRNLAGTYLFPLPADTTFSSFSLHIDGKPVEGQILEAEAARTQYEQIVRQMIDPGLLEYADYKTVRQRIFPIPAHGTKTVELEYTQLLKAEDGLVKYRFPLKTEGETAAADEVKLDLSLSAKQGVRSIWSPSHKIAVNRKDNNVATVAFAEKDTLPDKDFLLYYSISNQAMSANLLTHKSPDEAGYFLMTLNPPAMPEHVQGKDIVLVADTSGSMGGEKIEQTKRALKYVIKALGPDDKFGIVQFNTDVEAFKSQLSSATAQSKTDATAFADALEAHGGTNISEALHMGCKMLGDGDSARPAYLVLMTDGEPTVGETDIEKLLKSVAPKRDVRVFDFGVGYDVNTRFLDKLAEQHHGTTEYVEPKDNLETALSGFYQKIKSPVLTDASITFDGVETKDIYPREVKDIFAGTQVMLLGKYKGSGKAVAHLTGKLQGVQKAYSFNLNFEPDQAGNSYLPRLWAMRRIGHLTEVARENNNNREVVDEIVALSKKYGIITEFTSFLVTDPNDHINRLASMPVPMAAQAGPVGPVAGVHKSFYRGRTESPVPFNGPRQFQTMDDRPVINDLRNADAASGGPSALPKGPAGSAGKEGGGQRWNFAPNVYRIEQQKSTTGGVVSFLPSLPLPASGEESVLRAKKVSALKNADFVAVAPQALDAKAIKTVEDKTFYWRDGVWTESGLENKDAKAVSKDITFGSKDYFELIRKSPSIAKYLAIGERVEFKFGGIRYRILPATAS